MPVLDTYSKRKRRALHTGEDVYVYDALPRKLREQICHILSDALGTYYNTHGAYSHARAWRSVHNALARELGVPELRGELSTNTERDRCLTFVRGHRDTDEVLDLVEFSFQMIDRVVRRYGGGDVAAAEIKQKPDDAIDELNVRFRENGVGYQFVNGEIMRVDSQFIHSEVVRPALSLLSAQEFAGAQAEFLTAHAHYRAGEHKDAIVDAMNAFESVLKIICDAHKWECKKGARATDLIKVIRTNGLLPGYLDTSFDQLIATLTSGLPKVRNEEGGHGQGGTPRDVPGYVAGYALHLAAAKIVLLVEAHRALG